MEICLVQKIMKSEVKSDSQVLKQQIVEDILLISSHIKWKCDLISSELFIFLGCRNTVTWSISKLCLFTTFVAIFKNFPVKKWKHMRSYTYFPLKRKNKKKHWCYLCDCAGSDVVMKQHPNSNSGAEVSKTAAAATGSMLHSIPPKQHVSYLSIPPTRWIATSLGSGAFSQKWKPTADATIHLLVLLSLLFLFYPFPRRGHIAMQATALLLSALGCISREFQVSCHNCLNSEVGIGQATLRDLLRTTDVFHCFEDFNFLWHMFWQYTRG
jgi:hypothetical protein